MRTRSLMTTTLAAALAVTGLAVPSARATGGVTVTSSGCGKVRLDNSSGQAIDVLFDDATAAMKLPDDYYSTFTAVGSGPMTWVAVAQGTDTTVAAGRVVVSPCSTLPRRPLDGDQTGDGRADVLGIQAGTGDLYFYRMTATGLAGGVKAGTGWNQMVHVQQVNEFPTAGKGSAVIAVRSDGTVWRYRNDGRGRVSGGSQVGSGAAEADSITITSVNSGLAPALHFLLMVRDGQLLAASFDGKGVLSDWEAMGGSWPKGTRIIATRDVDGDGWADLVSIRPDGTMWLQGFDPWASAPSRVLTTARRMGSGWNAMQTVSSPGSLDGDALSDLIARRADGNLYKYLDRGGRWSAAVRIGQHWNGIRLLA